jgi:K(+)-stimulated pyrophosphate-energized sodium pump
MDGEDVFLDIAQTQPKTACCWRLFGSFTFGLLAGVLIGWVTE